MRDKLIELLQGMHNAVCDAAVGWLDSASYADQLNVEADYLIAHGVTFAEDNNVTCKWIPVSEGLPEHGDIVLCNTVFGIDVFQWDDRSRLWVGLEASHGRRFVKHWLPIPEAPKEGE